MHAMRDELIRLFPLLAQSLSTEEIDRLLGTLETRLATDGEVLLTAGKPSSWAFLLVDGAIRIILEPGDQRLDAGVLEPGCWLGEVSLLDGGPATATAIATAPTKLLVLRREALTSLWRDEPKVAAALVRAMSVAMAARIRRASDQLEALRVAAVQPEGSAVEALRTLFGARG
jgi:CRP-like cAMP-binding protein